MKTVLKVLRGAKKYWWALTLATIGMLANSFLGLYSPQVIRNLIRLIEVGDSDLANKALTLAAIYLAVAFFQMIAQFLKTYFNHYAAWHYVEDMRIKMYDHIQQLSFRFFHDKQTGQIMSRLLADSKDMELFIAHCIPDLISNTIVFVGVAIMLFIMNVRLALVTLLTLPFVAVAVWWYTTRVRPLFRNRHQKEAELFGVVQDNLSGIREIQIFNKQRHESEHVLGVAKDFTDLSLNAMFKSSLIHPLIGFLCALGTVVVIAYGGHLAALGMSGADVVAFVLYISKFYEPVNALGRLNEDLQNSLAAADRMFELLDVVSEVKEAAHPVDIGKAKGDVAFDHVNFYYNKGKNVLVDFSLDIKQGETVALVGPTGVGKTTVASLAARFYDPVDGSITLDGVDLRDISLASLRDNISIVLQDVFLFHGTVAENIAYGKDGATIDEIKAAARVANADEFIEAMPDAYDTIVGERGMKLSGGQKQRIAIARAVLMNRPILILDEATASVDNRTEKLIHEAIDKVIQNRTTIIIAHRLSTIKNADKIAVLDDGAIAEIGTHDELLARGGKYAALYMGGLENENN